MTLDVKSIAPVVDLDLQKLPVMTNPYFVIDQSTKKLKWNAQTDLEMPIKTGF